MVLHGFTPEFDEVRIKMLFLVVQKCSKYLNPRWAPEFHLSAAAHKTEKHETLVK